MIPIILVAGGIVAGTYGALIGAGGGFLLVPLLLFLYPEQSPAIIVATSLVAVLFSGVSGTIAYHRLRRIDYRMGIALMLATVPGALLGPRLVTYISRDVFQAVVGSILILVAVYIMVRSRRTGPHSTPKRPSANTRTLVDRQGTGFTYAVRPVAGSFVGFATGFVSSMLGVGGGILQVPLLVYALGIPIQVATATSTFIIVGTALMGLASHYFVGNLEAEWWVMATLVLGVVAGAQIGARLAIRFKGTRLAQLLAVGVAVVGARLLAGAL